MSKTKHRVPQIDARRLRRRLADLVRIPSVTGSEDQAIEWLARRLARTGAEVDQWSTGIGELVMDPAYPGHEVERAWVPVVVGQVRGRRPGPSVMLTGHVDVVPPGDYAQWSRDPFSGYMENDRLYGRGASDMKSGMVAALAAFEHFATGDRDFAGEVVYVAVPAEEDSGLGTLAAIRRGWHADVAMIPEPTTTGSGTELVVAHAGAMSMAVEVTGLSAHASKRLSGESALEQFWHVYQAMLEDERALNANERHPLMSELDLPYPTNIGTLHGGTWSSTVMEKLRAEVRIGVGVGESRHGAEERFRAVIEGAARKSAWLAEHPPVVHRQAAGFGSAVTPSDHPLVEQVSEAARDVFGRRPRLRGVPYGCDMAGWVRLCHMPTVVYGPGDIEWAHAADEWVSIGQTRKVAAVLARATERLLAMDQDELPLLTAR